MKKLLITVFMLIAVSVAVIPSVSDTYADEENNLYGELFYSYLVDFVESNPARVAFSDGEHKAADWLYEKFSALDYEARYEKFSYKGYFDSAESVEKESANIVAIKPSNGHLSSKKVVIIGAHYDNSMVVGGGAFDNASGVATMLTMAEVMKNYDLPFELRFVAFGAEEPGLVGSSECVIDFVNEADKEIILMINLDVCVGGENLYVYCEDIVTPQLEFIDGVIKENGFDIEARVDMNEFAVGLTYYSPAFTHIGMLNDAFSFKQAGVPTAFFFSGSLDNGFGTYAENSDGENIMHTDKDMLEHYIGDVKNENKFKKDADILVKTIEKCLTDESFCSKMDDAVVVRNTAYSVEYPMLVFVLLYVLVVVFMIVAFGRIRNRRVFESDVAAKSGTGIFTAPDEDDVFEFRE